jgi:hypothetical protein
MLRLSLTMWVCIIALAKNANSQEEEPGPSTAPRFVLLPTAQEVVQICTGRGLTSFLMVVMVPMHAPNHYQLSNLRG